MSWQLSWHIWTFTYHSLCVDIIIYSYHKFIVVAISVRSREPPQGLFQYKDAILPLDQYRKSHDGKRIFRLSYLNNRICFLYHQKEHVVVKAQKSNCEDTMFWGLSYMHHEISNTGKMGIFLLKPDPSANLNLFVSLGALALIYTRVIRQGPQWHSDNLSMPALSLQTGNTFSEIQRSCRWLSYYHQRYWRLPPTPLVKTASAAMVLT